ncbi:MAG: hypothetical protein NZM25_07275 [Leptospiraceae bacterium]|nr:hypothetical protein [Leptospiraceae bacterium]MDW8307120.1 hypothetical protein [Leptospiraceae bacterium]
MEATKSLLVFSHRQAAQVFLESLKTEGVGFLNGFLYESPQAYILISGEHPLQVASRIGLCLGFLNKKVKEVLHLGLAMGLSLEKGGEGTITEARTVYGASGLLFWHKSFTLSEKGYDIITSGHRVKKKEEIEHFARIAPLLDRESYSLCMVCEETHTPLRIFKYIVSRESEHACQEVKSLYQEISLKLYHFWLYYSIEEKPQEICQPPGDVYFTTSMAKQYEEYYTILKERDNLTQEEIWKKAGLEEIQRQKLSPKQKGKKLLNRLFELAYPEEYAYRQRFVQNIQSLVDAGWTVDLDNSLRQDALYISARIKDSREKERLLEALRDYHEI